MTSKKIAAVGNQRQIESVSESKIGTRACLASTILSGLTTIKMAG